MDRREFGKTLIATLAGTAALPKVIQAATDEGELVSVCMQPSDVFRDMLVDGEVQFRLEDCHIVHVEKVRLQNVERGDICWFNPQSGKYELFSRNEP